MLTPRTRQLPPAGQTWAADNGRFNSPQDYDDESYLEWLRSLEPHRERCLFATAPDVVGDATSTLALSAPMLPRIREAGYPAALVAQDGLRVADVPWDEMDALFVGGTTSWKTSERARELCEAATARGKWVHMGRVNSGRRMRVAAAFGCGSVDGNLLIFGPDTNAPRVARWLHDLHARPGLWDRR